MRRENLLRKFDPECNEKIVDCNNFRYFKLYEYKIIIQSFDGKRDTIQHIKIRFPFTPDDLIFFIIKNHAIKLGWPIEKLKDEFQYYFSENGSLLWICEEMNEIVCMLTYTDFFSDQRYGQKCTLNYFCDDTKSIKTKTKKTLQFLIILTIKKLISQTLFNK